MRRGGDGVGGAGDEVGRAGDRVGDRCGRASGGRGISGGFRVRASSAFDCAGEYLYSVTLQKYARCKNRLCISPHVSEGGTSDSALPPLLTCGLVQGKNAGIGLRACALGNGAAVMGNISILILKTTYLIWKFGS